MTYDITFSKPDGEVLGKVTVSPTSLNLYNDLWWLLNRIFPTGLFPYLDPSFTFQQFRRLPNQLDIRGVGPVRVFQQEVANAT
jgi:hypothetical protein